MSGVNKVTFRLKSSANVSSPTCLIHVDDLCMTCARVNLLGLSFGVMRSLSSAGYGYGFPRLSAKMFRVLPPDETPNFRFA